MSELEILWILSRDFPDLNVQLTIYKWRQRDRNLQTSSIENFHLGVKMMAFLENDRHHVRSIAVPNDQKRLIGLRVELLNFW